MDDTTIALYAKVYCLLLADLTKTKTISAFFLHILLSSYKFSYILPFFRQIKKHHPYEVLNYCLDIQIFSLFSKSFFIWLTSSGLPIKEQVGFRWQVKPYEYIIAKNPLLGKFYQDFTGDRVRNPGQTGTSSSHYSLAIILA
jgi:hypothetical protein